MEERVKNGEQVEEKPKVKKVKVNHDEGSSDEEGWNGGMWMFRGTVIMEDEKLKREKEEQSTGQSSSLVGYDNDDSDDDDAPEEIKTVVSYENDVPDENDDDETDKKSSKKSRKRKKKQNTADDKSEDVTEIKPAEQTSEAEDAIKKVRATIQSHIQSFDNPPVPGEDDLVQDAKLDSLDAIPDLPEAAKDLVEELPSSSNEKAKQFVPVVFKKRLRHPTLLERLLLSEIKSERNTILQCVRYVCKNKFFQSD